MGGAVAAKGAGAVWGSGSAFAPGMRNVAGETLPLTLIPEQPALPNVKNVSIASRNKFQFNLTRLL
jgi:hypothetical protein